MAGVKGKSGRKPNELVIRQNLLNILDQVDPSTERKRMLNIIHKLVEAAEDGKMDAINAIMDRVDGKPQQDMHHTGGITVEGVQVTFRAPKPRDT